ncbi:unnamed protein product [Heterobilharzia americana]|nr:unnamed protein product [Heterobilharzia americana]
MKFMLAKAREINRLHTARMIAHCLELCYLQVEAASNNHVERGSEGLQTVKELARRLNLSFGLDLLKIRKAMVAFHARGIHFCLSRVASAASADGQSSGVPSNLLFLEVLSEFSNKLIRHDKKLICEYVRLIFPNPVGSELASLHAYRSSLDPDATDTNPGHDGSSQITNPLIVGQINSLLTQGRGKRLRGADFSRPGIITNLNSQSLNTVIKRRRVNFKLNLKNISGNLSKVTSAGPSSSPPSAEMSFGVDCASLCNPCTSITTLTPAVHSSHQ